MSSGHDSFGILGFFSSLFGWRGAIDERTVLLDLKMQIKTDISRFLYESKWIWNLNIKDAQRFSEVIKINENYDAFCHAFSRLHCNISCWMKQETTSIAIFHLVQAISNIVELYFDCLTVNRLEADDSITLEKISTMHGHERANAFHAFLFSGECVWQPLYLFKFRDALLKLHQDCSL